MNFSANSITKYNLAAFLLILFGGIKGFVVIPLLFNLLGKEGYGLYVLVASSTGYGIITALLGLDTSIYRLMPSRNGTRGGVITLNSILQAGLCWNAVIILCTMLYVFAWGQGTSFERLLIFGVMICAGHALFGLGAAENRAREKIIEYAALVLGFQALELAVLIAGAAYFEDAVRMFGSVAVYDLSAAIIVLMFRWFGLGITRPSMVDATVALKFGFYSALHQAIGAAYYICDKYIIAAYAGLVTLASYGVAFAISAVLLQVAGVGAILVPTLFARAVDSEDKSEQMAVIKGAFTNFSLFAVPSFFGILFIGEPLMGLLTNMDTAERAYPIAGILSFAFLLSGYSRILIIALRTVGIQKLITGLLLSLLTCFVSLSLLFVHFGVVISWAVAYGFLGTEILQIAVLTLYARKIIPLRFDWFQALKSIIASVIMGLPLFIYSPESAGALVGFIILAIAIYFGLIFCFRSIESVLKI
ncbi:MAG: oligosaccharide flippase family protein [Alphaproteobacteria bacterium]|nr:oligosaccharide flippase family protein [Alphaproteobacteria bacterium]